MAIKCPACGFDSPDGASWCDFCKEPFLKKGAKREEFKPQPAAAQAPTKQPEPEKELPKDVLAKIEAGLKPGADGEKIPVAPDWVRTYSWTFLVVVCCAALCALALVWQRFKLIQSMPDTPAAAEPPR